MPTPLVSSRLLRPSLLHEKHPTDSEQFNRNPQARQSITHSVPLHRRIVFMARNTSDSTIILALSRYMGSQCMSQIPQETIPEPRSHNIPTAPWCALTPAPDLQHLEEVICNDILGYGGTLKSALRYAPRTHIYKDYYVHPRSGVLYPETHNNGFKKKKKKKKKKMIGCRHHADMSTRRRESIIILIIENFT